MACGGALRRGMGACLWGMPSLSAGILTTFLARAREAFPVDIRAKVFANVPRARAKHTVGGSFQCQSARVRDGLIWVTLVYLSQA